MSAIDTKFYEKKRKNTLYFSLWFFLFVFLITGGIYTYNISLENKISRWDKQLENIKESISELEQNPEIEAYSLYERNKELIAKKSCESRITTFITHLKRNAGKYSLAAKGFSYSRGEISTEISASSDEGQSAYEKIVNFLDVYPQEENAFFDIHHIWVYDGYDRINFSPRFTLNSNMYENCQQEQ